MSAPHTNVEKQRRRHIASLAGMALAVLFGVGVIAYWLFEEAAESDPPPPPQATETQPSNIVPPSLPPEVQKGVPGTDTAPVAPPPAPGTGGTD